jgi:hypothetical protein
MGFKLGLAQARELGGSEVLKLATVKVELNRTVGHRGGSSATKELTGGSSGRP